MPTFAELAGATAPPCDGISFLPSLLGTGQQRQHDYLYWEFNESAGPMQALRFDGKWKAYRAWGKAAIGPIQLFDLEDDPSEKKSVAQKHPELVKRAEQLFKAARTPHDKFPLTKRGKSNSKKH